MDKSIHSNEYKVVLLRLKKARMEAGLTQVQVADKLGHHQSYISKIESGERRVDVVELNRIAKLYGKKVNHFL
ncbi:helix-turn-helix transcriptional regulator [Patescibacteria group bacterium]|nr:helix-turn-helix transcriptional regulator [Patescibacteria group bacterium]